MDLNNIPSGMIERVEVLKDGASAIYGSEDDLGGIDIQVLGIGRTGHIGFNEPGSHLNSGTRNIKLDHITRVDAAPAFLGIDNAFPEKRLRWE